MDISYTIIFCITFVLISLGVYLFSKIQEFLNAHLAKSQIEILKFLAQQAVVYIRKEYGNKTGQEQFDESVNYLIKLLESKGIKLDKEIIKSAVQDAYKQAQIIGIVKPLD